MGLILFCKYTGSSDPNFSHPQKVNFLKIRLNRSLMLHFLTLTKVYKKVPNKWYCVGKDSYSYTEILLLTCRLFFIVTSYEPCHEKTCMPGKAQTSLFSHKWQLQTSLFSHKWQLQTLKLEYRN